MGLSITIKDAVFTNFLASLLPVTDGLKIHFDFGGSIESSKVNKITGVPATVAGTPTVLTDSVIVSNKNGFKTDLVAETNNRTYIVVTKSAVNSILAGHTSYDDSSNQPKSTALVMTNSQFGMQYMSQLYAQSSVQSNVGSTVRFVAGVVNGNNLETYINSTNNLTKFSGVSGLTNTNFFPFSVGAYNVDSSLFPNNVETHEVLYFDRALSQSEIETTYLSLKNKYSSKGINIA